MTGGVASTVNVAQVFVVAQLTLPDVAVIVLVPLLIPVANPLASIVATAPLLLDQVTPPSPLTFDSTQASLKANAQEEPMQRCPPNALSRLLAGVNTAV